MILLKSSIVLLLLDSIYLTLFSKHFSDQVNDVQKSPLEFRLIPAILCYIALIFGLNYFVLNTNKSNEQKILDAVLLGLVIYAVYEMTTYTILKDWN